MNWIINALSVVNVPEPETVVMSNFTISDTQDGLTGSVTYSVNLLPADTKTLSLMQTLLKPKRSNGRKMLWALTVSQQWKPKFRR